MEAAGDDPDRQRLIEYLRARGAREEELHEAARTGTLGPLGLELALRSEGERVPFAEGVERAGLALDEGVALWRALGFPDPLRAKTSLSTSAIETFRVLAGIGSFLGQEGFLQIARLMSASLAPLAEAIVDTFRVNVEMPRREAGEPQSQVVEDYSNMASVALPALERAMADVLRAHILAVARGSWSMDEERVAVTRELTVGFADLVGYTSATRAMTTAELAATIARFEATVTAVLAAHDGRLVKLIGDEAMFVAQAPEVGCIIARELTDKLANERLPEVRIGLAAGPVVGLRGDYYGDPVNLAARLVKLAQPGEILASGPLVEALGPERRGFETIETPSFLKGYAEPVAAFRVRLREERSASPGR